MKKILFISLLVLCFCCDKIEYNNIVHYSTSCYFPVPSILNESNLKAFDSIEPLIIADLSENLREGLIAYYPFDDSTKDESPNMLDGIVKNGINEEIAFFNDVADSTYIEIEDDSLLDFTGEFSLCVWFNNNHEEILPQGLLGKPRDDGGSGYYIMLARPFERDSLGKIIKTFPPKIIFGAKNICEYSSIDLINGWHFVVGTYNKEFLKLYIDGNLVNQVFENNAVFQFDQSLYIGRECKDVDFAKTARFFYGAIDNVMIYDYALSDSAIVSLYNLRQ